MAFQQSVAVTIEFAGAASFGNSPAAEMPFQTRSIRVIESKDDRTCGFTVHDGDSKQFMLSVEENDHLLRLLSGLEVNAPWTGCAGFDGCEYQLTLTGVMSSVTFRWWLKAPPEWEQAGRVFDYVLELADGLQTGN